MRLSRIWGLVTPRRRHAPPAGAVETSFSRLSAQEQGDFTGAMNRFISDSSNSATWQPLQVLVKPRSIGVVARLDPGGRRLFVKRRRVDARADRHVVGQQVLNDSDVTSCAFKQMPALEGCQTVPLVATYPEHLVQVYEYVDGQSLQDLVFNAAVVGGSGGSKALGLISLAGRWLAAYQKQTSVPGAQWSIEELLKYCVQTWSLFEARYPRLADGFCGRRITRWALEEYGRLTDRERMALRCHGDFGPFNMLVTDSSHLVILDFESTLHGSYMLDPCYFLHQLWKLLLNPFVSRPFIAEAKGAFIRGYGSERWGPQPLVRLEKGCRCIAALSYLCGERGVQRGLSALHDTYFATACLRKLHQLMGEADRQAARGG